MDAVEWSQERFKDICDQLKPFLRAQPYKDKNVSYVPVSGLSGENLVKPSSEAKLLGMFVYTRARACACVSLVSVETLTCDMCLFEISAMFTSHVLFVVSGPYARGFLSCLPRTNASEHTFLVAQNGSVG